MYFIWLGKLWDKPLYDSVLVDIQKLGLQSRVRFVGLVENPLHYFAAADAFALTSREDPFPLVCLEAASTGCPIVCFDKAGGANELVEDDAGIVVPYLDVQRMAESLHFLIREPEIRKQLGRRAREKVLERFDISVGAPKLLKIIEEFLV